MKCKPWRWLWGLLPLALLGYFMVLGERARIEGDLTERARIALDESGFDWAQPRFEGRDASIEGTATEGVQREKALELVRNLYGVRVADDRSDVLAKVSPYTWVARLERTRLVLKGYVPNEAGRRTIVGVARATFPGIDISDKMRLAAGAPDEDDWLGAQSFSLKQLTKLRKGQVALSDLNLEIEGVAQTGADYLSIKQALKDDMPSRLRLSADRTVPPKVSPYVFNAKYSGQVLTLGGYLPDNVMQRDISSAVRDLFPGVEIVDRVGLGYGAPSELKSAVTLVLKSLAELKNGEAKFTDGQLVFVGRATTEELAKKIEVNLREGLPRGFSIDDTITFDEKLPPVVDPYTIGADISEKRIVVNGHIGSETDRRRVLAALREDFDGFEIVDRMTIARTMPKQFVRAVRSALDGLKILDDGKARSFRFTDTRVVIRGASFDASAASKVRQAARRAMPQGYTIEADIERLEKPEPDLDWGAAYTENKLMLEGEVPDAQTRRALLAEARRAFSDVEILDKMTIKSGESANWAEVALIGLRQLSKLTGGRAILSGQQLVISGETSDSEVPDSVRVRLSDGVRAPYRASSNITVKEQVQEKVAEKGVPDLDWGAEYTGTRVVIEGEVPNAATRTALMSDAERTFPESQIIDRMTVKEGVSDRWSIAASTALRQLGRLRKGRVILSGRQIIVQGETFDSDIPRAVRLNLDEGIPKPYSARASIDLKEDPAEVAKRDEEAKRAEAERREREAEERRAQLEREERRKREDEAARRREEERLAALEREREEEARKRERERLAALEREREETERRRREPEEEKRRAEAARIAAEEERQRLEAERRRLAEAEKEKPKGIYSWSATYDGERVLIEGSVPSDRDRQALIDDIRDQFPRAFISDKTSVRDDAPKNWLKAAKSTIGQLARLEKGKAEIRDREIDVSGEARNERNKRSVEQGFDRQRPREFKAREKVAIVKPKIDSEEILKKRTKLKTGTCQAAIDDLLSNSVIRFDIASAKIKRESRPLLDKLAGLARRCRQASILISGHTDSDGGARYNRRLSLRRARAVYRYLIRKKVSRRRLRIKGFGETKPIAPNDDRNNKALNRRIEFSLRS